MSEIKSIRTTNLKSCCRKCGCKTELSQLIRHADNLGLSKLVCPFCGCKMGKINS